MERDKGIHLRSIVVDRSHAVTGGFPFNVPAIQSLTQLEFTSPVTFFVGENGCGKSTLLEAIACAIGAITVGREDAETDDTLAAVRALARCLKLTWSVRTHRGFFMRAEDFFGYARKMAMMRDQLQRDLERVEKEYENRSRTAQMYAKAAYQSQLRALEDDYGEGLDMRSHGESFLDFFQTRFVPGGLYLLDEPEAPLSPLRQMSFLVLLKQMVESDAQLLIATHSPIIMAFPNATILNMDGGEIGPVDYEDLEHVRITRGFLNRPQSYLDHLFE
jgi:predicted ATPase